MVPLLLIEWVSYGHHSALRDLTCDHYQLMLLQPVLIMTPTLCIRSKDMQHKSWMIFSWGIRAFGLCEDPQRNFTKPQRYHDQATGAI
ncbi:hypothetical protein ACN38_g66 [Penicillium nordicum]|uniref:Uncharacterized protein n=1 Tax=Penicillium nordicum TaxID=229535 RepID=A0A0M8PJL7_9EURO|nr:hypothetical protein ACN38_g66 [Penicillium nordicum]